MESVMRKSHIGMYLKIGLAVIILAILLVSFRYFKIQSLLKQSLDWLSGLGEWAPVIFILLYILACVFLIPGSILTLGAGVVFGVVRGSALVSVAAILGATAAFLVGRYFARDWVSRKILGNPKFAAIDEAVAREGWKIVFLTRLSPIFPFNILNYAFGLTRVTLKEYFIASWLGMLPGTILYVYIGSLAGDLARLGTGGRTRTTGEWIFYIVGLFATVIVTIYVTKIARKALDKQVK